MDFNHMVLQLAFINVQNVLKSAINKSNSMVSFQLKSNYMVPFQLKSNFMVSIQFINGVSPWSIEDGNTTAK